MNISICAIAKNETPYLLEWCAHNKVIGIDHITIYDNNSTIPIKETLSKYIDEQFVSVIEWDVPEPQMKAYDDYLQKYSSNDQFCCFIDVDEYIINKTDKPLKEVLQKFEKAGSFQISWRLFGSSGHKTKTDGLTIEIFTMATPFDWHENLHTKAIVNTGLVKKNVKFNSNPHCVLFNGNYVALSEDFQLVKNAWSKKFCANELQLNHYVIRSLEEFAEKCKKGRCDTDKFPGKQISDFKYFDEMATEKDECALIYTDRTIAELNRLKNK